ncbi:MAG TPA: hypothetical protein VFJ94_14555 [Intrasporangium sp.]|uniref:hypothetical protein n=1 Tax=Intrasporangium sp. TaxID=1925024 RepID=UPI002D77B5AE|nr:hypothetical protein [Intrasporangium sp.]HET7399735.1 hypothetical protein [Intrasporangium sp.]
MHVMRTLSALVLALVAGCGTGGPQPGPGSGDGPTAVDRCPPVASGGPVAIVDYVDFIRTGGVEFLAGLGDVPATADQIGSELFRITCSYSELNRRTGHQPPPPVDGGAGLLPAGTPVHAVAGWPPRCRLAAQRDGRWQVYRATVPGAKTMTYAACAATPSTSAKPPSQG